MYLRMSQSTAMADDLICPCFKSGSVTGMRGVALFTLAVGLVIEASGGDTVDGDHWLH